jgi:N-acyl-L-homoserine lactone synthetase
MIHLVTTENRRLYEEALTNMHLERKRHFVDGRGWSLDVRDGGEYDAYDDEQANYLIGFDAAGLVSVSARLRPTATGGVIADVFPQLLAPRERPIQSGRTFECTRYFTSANRRGIRGFEARSKLHIAMVEAMQDLGADRLVGLADLELLTHLRRFSGLRLRPIGLPCPYDDGGTVIAFEIGIGPDDLAHAKRVLQIGHRQLFIAPPWLPPGSDVLAMERAVAVLLAAGEAERAALRDRVSRVAEAIVYHSDVKAVMASLDAAAA